MSQAPTSPSKPSALRSAVGGFSTLVPAGGAVGTCPLQAKATNGAGTPGSAAASTKASKPSAKVADKPCNLDLMQVTEPKGSPQGKDGARYAQFKPGGKLKRRQSPVELRAGQDPFHITATSARQGKRKLQIAVQQGAHCGHADHKLISVVGPGLTKAYSGNSATIELARQPLAGDNGVPFGLWAAVNAGWQACRGPAHYTISAYSCGLPASAKGVPTATLAGEVQVWPADQYKLSLSIPALLEPSALKLDKASDNWTTDKQKETDRRNAQADSYFQEHKDFLKEAGVSRKDVRDFVNGMGKKASGEDDEHFVDQLKIDFSQTDGQRTLKASVDDVVKLVRAIRRAEYAIKQVDKWLENATVGPGASFSLAVQFFSGSIAAEWGQTEYLDDRVYLAWKGSISIELVKLELKLAIGWRCAGLADLFIELGGEGTLSATGSAACVGPDDPVEFKLSPKGELKLSGMIKAQLMWAVKGETGLECTFKAELDEFHFMRAKGSALSGQVTIGREPVYRVITYSNRLWGGTTEEKEEVIKADENLAQFKFG
jgi:hypothetical protein